MIPSSILSAFDTVDFQRSESHFLTRIERRYVVCMLCCLCWVSAHNFAYVICFFAICTMYCLYCSLLPSHRRFGTRSTRHFFFVCVVHNASMNNKLHILGYHTSSLCVCVFYCADNMLENVTYSIK